jgi:hypothetical protein
VVRFFKNLHDSAVPIPLFETSFSPEVKLRAYAEFEPGGGGAALDPSRLSRVSNRGYNYTANQQVDDFGSAQSSIKVRVYQESALVGVGPYREANL